MNVLLIGHGYLGSALAERLHESGTTVAAASRGATPGPAWPVIECDVGDRLSVESLRDRLDWQPDAIVHCASSSRGGAEAYRAVFVDGITHLRAVFRDTPVLFTSSSSVYGQTDGSVVEEDAPTEPDRETSRLLLEAERLVLDGGGCALRLAGIYGPGRSIYLRRLFEGTATIEEVESGSAGPGPSVAGRFINQVHRDDAVSAIALLLEKGPEVYGGRIFNVADDFPLTQPVCYSYLAALFDRPRPPAAPPDLERKRAWTHKIVSNRALREVGWRPEFPSFLDAVEKDPRLVPSIRDLVAKDPG